GLLVLNTAAARPGNQTDHYAQAQADLHRRFLKDGLSLEDRPDLKRKNHHGAWPLWMLIPSRLSPRRGPIDYSDATHPWDDSVLSTRQNQHERQEKPAPDRRARLCSR